VPSGAPVFCDVCGAQLANGDQVVGNGQPGTPFRHAACNAAGFRDAAAGYLPDDTHTR
jgi:hypothetical protein